MKSQKIRTLTGALIISCSYLTAQSVQADNTQDMYQMPSKALKCPKSKVVSKFNPRVIRVRPSLVPNTKFVDVYFETEEKRRNHDTGLEIREATKDEGDFMGQTIITGHKRYSPNWLENPHGRFHFKRLVSDYEAIAYGIKKHEVTHHSQQAKNAVQAINNCLKNKNISFEGMDLIGAKAINEINRVCRLQTKNYWIHLTPSYFSFGRSSRILSGFEASISSSLYELNLVRSLMAYHQSCQKGEQVLPLNNIAVKLIRKDKFAIHPSLLVNEATRKLKTYLTNNKASMDFLLTKDQADYIEEYADSFLAHIAWDLYEDFIPTEKRMLADLKKEMSKQLNSIDALINSIDEATSDSSPMITAQLSKKAQGTHMTLLRDDNDGKKFSPSAVRLRGDLPAWVFVTNPTIIGEAFEISYPKSKLLNRTVLNSFYNSYGFQTSDTENTLIK